MRENRGRCVIYSVLDINGKVMRLRLYYFAPEHPRDVRGCIKIFNIGLVRTHPPDHRLNIEKHRRYRELYRTSIIALFQHCDFVNSILANNASALCQFSLLHRRNFSCTPRGRWVMHDPMA